MSPQAPRRRRLQTTAVDDDEFVEHEAPLASGRSIYCELSEDYGVVMATTVKWWHIHKSRLEQIVQSGIALLNSQRKVEDEFVQSEAPIASMPDICERYSLHPLPFRPEE